MLRCELCQKGADHARPVRQLGPSSTELGRRGSPALSLVQRSRCVACHDELERAAALKVELSFVSELEDLEMERSVHSGEVAGLA